MKQTVQLFAQARDLTGRPVVELELADDARVADLRGELLRCCPELGLIAPQLLITVNEAYVDDSFTIPPAARVGCFPPVSGG